MTKYSMCNLSEVNRFIQLRFCVNRNKYYYFETEREEKTWNPSYWLLSHCWLQEDTEFNIVKNSIDSMFNTLQKLHKLKDSSTRN